MALSVDDRWRPAAARRIRSSRDVELLDLATWCREPDAADERVLARCVGPTLDIGCGPGRMVVELRRRGVPALGIDVAAEAVRRVRRQGGAALQRSVFCPIPAEGQWSTALLLDGCVGIGGDPVGLLCRLGELLRTTGVGFVEYDPAETDMRTGQVRIADVDGRPGPRTSWARLGRDALVDAARTAGMEVRDAWTEADRGFAEVARPT